MMLSLFVVVLCGVVVSMSKGNIVITCPGSDPNDDCNCQQTENLYCPPGYYCPQYSDEVIAENSDVIAEENCTVRADGELQCPCTPGFYCPENTTSPSYCCESVRCYFEFLADRNYC